MAKIPDKPHTDLEQYLNRIATGEGEYPAEPHTNVEQYLNYIIENGTGGEELVTELPAEGKEGKLYVLVDDATAPTKAYGVYTYAGGQYIVIAQPIDQSVQKVTTLPTEGQEGVLYYLETSQDTYDLYRWINNGWVKVDTDVVLYSQEGNNVDGAMTQAATTAMKGQAKILTTADYNWPTDNPTGVALWLLEPGTYTKDGSFYYLYKDSGTSLDTNFNTVIIGRKSGNNIPMIAISKSPFSLYKIKFISMRYDGASTSAEMNILDNSFITNDLTSTSTSNVLSAAQGKVLKDLVDSLAIREAGAPTTTTVGQVGTLYEDTTNGKLYQCTAIDTTTDPDTYTWEEVGGGPAVVQTTGTSTTDVMSQKATTDMIFEPGYDPSSVSTPRIKIVGESRGVGDRSIAIGKNASARGNYNIALGSSASANGPYATTIGDSADASWGQGVAVGARAKANSAYATSVGFEAKVGISNNGGIAIGAYSSATQAGEMNIGSTYTSYGYNNSNYRLLTGVYDGQDAHDAATYGQLSTAILNGGTTAPTTATVGAVGTLYSYVDISGTTPAPHLMVCTAVDDTDPQNIVYTWAETGGGGGQTVTPLTDNELNNLWEEES